MAEYGLSRPAPTFFERARRPEKIFSLMLLLILVTAAAASVTSVLTGPDWGSLWRSLFFGLLAGWSLAIARQSTGRSIAAILIAGFAYILIFTGGLAGKLGAVWMELARLGYPLAPPEPGNFAGYTRLIAALRDLLLSSGVVMARMRLWLLALSAGQPAFDPVAAALIWGLLVWIVAAWAGWVVEARRSALLAVLPAVMLSIGTLSYGERWTLLLYFMLGAALILLATVQQDQREQDWDKNGVAYPANKGRQVGAAAVLLGVSLVLLAAFTSSLSYQRVMAWASKLRSPAPRQEGGLAKSLGIQPAATPTPDPFHDLRSPGLPRDLLIGSGPELSKRMVMTVKFEDLSAISQNGEALPLYWRSFTYDVYTGSGWRSSQIQEKEQPANQPFSPDQAPGHLLVRQIVRPVSGGAVYAAGEPVTINLQGNAAWRSAGDLFGIRIPAGTSYEASSLLPVPDDNALRQAGQNYPDWVQQRYLALPPEVPGRVKALAIELTASEPTPYDRARAIERYLRTFPYSLDVPRPPLNRDLVDFFLFDLKRGYCDYYASAMVVLARAAGIPARLAIGYASGTYNLNSGRFVVSEADAHSWVEVYFPNLGWVPFEPTAALPALDRASSAGPVATPAPPPQNNTEIAPAQGLPGGWLFPLIGLGIAVLALAALALIDRLRLRRLPEARAAAEVYRRMQGLGARLRVVAEPGDTPLEFAASLNAELQALAHQGVSPGFVSPILQAVEVLTGEIVQASYRPGGLGRSSGVAISRQWGRLRWRLRLLWVIKQGLWWKNQVKSRLAAKPGRKQSEEGAAQ